MHQLSIEQTVGQFLAGGFFFFIDAAAAVVVGVLFVLVFPVFLSIPVRPKENAPKLLLDSASLRQINLGLLGQGLKFVEHQCKRTRMPVRQSHYCT